ncbi:MAG: 5-methylcytosine-specific restriction endonuclease system specificity protein McrC [Veillonellaceae bacterium]|nr:5-methylcytosine-specific restriction endonuclease system specificity protein McrC [Veillonellaceae bacterium]
MIKIKNIYYMLAYAFQVLKEDSYAKVEAEDFEHIGDLFAAILAKGIANQIKKGLGREYVSVTETRSTPVGKIIVSDSIKQNSLRNKQVICERDEFTENAYMNKILKTTAMLLTCSPEVSLQQKKALKKVMIFFCEVDELDPNRIQWGNIKYHRNNATYKMLVNLCYLIIAGMLLTEQAGTKKLAKYLDDQRMHSLYEKFVLHYYRKKYPQFHASAAHIDWDIDDGIVEFLPTMKSDITLECNGKTLIIDTKYYAHTMQTNGLYNSRTMHSNNMYQIFTYVKNLDVSKSGNISGVLLYAKTDEEVVPDNEYMMSGNRISVKTLDLNADFADIEHQLGKVASNLLA